MSKYPLPNLIEHKERSHTEPVIVSPGPTYEGIPTPQNPQSGTLLQSVEDDKEEVIECSLVWK